MAQLEDSEKYIAEWTRMQLIIWMEKIERLDVIRTGALHESFVSQIRQATTLDEASTISMKFLEYGLYQDSGTGNGYKHDNGGYLEFLDEGYREEHKLNIPRRAGSKNAKSMSSGNPRTRKRWYYKKLLMSKMNLQEDLARIIGENAVMIVKETLEKGKTSRLV